ncbi:hypothetical protein BZA05DRAFT_53218 [Tricharina praecox]|uniref:uncharacterized protein n=1 Tax=Tricharina praecox TaxID=43433 RepID=UPI00221FCA37|nr:uncharacterized protein BZA05DRAFT_53218 [Tricharina praecox]KAI5850929.1 hypothetical protein BZA05DRAFT_53218 [Tricharina praecox]
MLDSSSPNIHHNNVAGIKRLLPAFEPTESPPRFKRQKPRAEAITDENRYPTPVPSSSVGVIPSSPPLAPTQIAPVEHQQQQQLQQQEQPQQQPQLAPRRPNLRRTQSTVSERAPLSAVPSITLPENGQPILLGRSSNSSHYRLSANRLISRVHIKAVYHAVTTTSKPKIVIECLGWNGTKVHCQGRAWELLKDDIFVSETEHEEIMLDVHDSRVVLAWPIVTRASSSFSSTSTTTATGGPPTAGAPANRVIRSPSPEWEGNDENAIPWEGAQRISARAKLTPVSPTPRRNVGNSLNAIASASMAETFLDIYEDEPEEEGEEEEGEQDEQEQEQEQEVEAEDEDEDEAQIELPPLVEKSTSRFSRSYFKDVPEASTDVVHTDEIAQSFDCEPMLPPMSLFSTRDPLRHRPRTPPLLTRRARDTSVTLPPSSVERRRSASTSPSKYVTLQNHLTNQLAFSRVNTMPLSELYANLPTALAATVTMERVKEMLLGAECIGEIKRSGKDAAGKPLENQYYYILEQDKDDGRKSAVGGKARMRNCRKEHKQYYWKKPKKISY